MAVSVNKDELIKMGREHLWLSFGKDASYFDKVGAIIVSGDGSYLVDVEGNRWLDGWGGAGGAAILGYNNRQVIEAMIEQTKKITSNPVGWPATVPAIQLAEKLASLPPNSLTHTHFGCTGTDACETAVQIARQYWRIRGQGSKVKTICRYRDYHGGSLAMLSAGGIVSRRKSFEPLPDDFEHINPPYCYRCPYEMIYPECGIECAQELRRIIEFLGASNIACFMGEQTIVAGGIIPPPPEYMKIIHDICNEYDILLIVDEVSTGFGKTGTWFEVEQYGIVPDIMVIAKSLTAGYAPLSGVRVKKEIAEAFTGRERVFEHGTTQGALPISCAAGLATIRVIEEMNLIPQVAEKSKFGLSELEKMKKNSDVVGDVRVKGLVWGIELVKNKETREMFPESTRYNIQATIAEVGRENGVMLTSNPWLGTIILHIRPFLNAGHEEIELLLSATEKALKEVERHFG